MFFIEDIWYQLRRIINALIFVRRRNRLIRYSIPVVLILLVLAIDMYISPVFGSIASFHLLALVIVLSALYGGFGAGLLATLLSVLLNQFLIIPSVYSSGESYIHSFILGLEGLLISAIAEARKQAENKKDVFIGIASHELKNPLTTIKAYVSLVKKHAMKKREKSLEKYAERLDDQVSNITNLINELLDLTRIETGSLVFEKSIFSINDLVQQVVKDEELTIKSHRILFKGGSRSKIFGDKNRIAQVLTNLISNAVKYSPNSDNVVVGIVDSGNRVIVDVEDFGKGISKKDKRRLFEKFYRSEDVKSSIQGLGIGLYVSSQIVKKHRGKLSVRSESGKGSVFSLVLPVVRH